jgi:hypothetical protein
MPISIFFASWNLDNTMPNPADFTSLLNGPGGGVPTAAQCDVLVLGLQEATDGPGLIDSSDQHTQAINHMGGFGRWSPALPPMQAAGAVAPVAPVVMPPHGAGTDRLRGSTKMIVNYQTLLVTVNVVAGAGGWRPIDTHVNHWGAPPPPGGMNLGRHLRNLVNLGEQGKGGIVRSITLEANGGGMPRPRKTLAFVTSHLDSRDAQTRNFQIHQVWTAVQGLPGGIGTLDAIFWMGDLNYRLALGSNNNTPPNDIPAVAPANAGAAAINTRSLAWLSGRLCNPALRQGLMTVRDTFVTQPSPLIAPLAAYPPGGYAFTFPDPGVGAGLGGNLFWPTYKRTKQAPAPVTPGGPGVNNAAYAAAITGSYGTKIKMKHGYQWIGESERAGEMDLGWLDRIGYRTLPGTNVQFNHYFARHDLNISDHVPVCAVVTVT